MHPLCIEKYVKRKDFQFQYYNVLNITKILNLVSECVALLINRKTALTSVRFC